MKKISLIGMAICCFLLAGAQENDNKRAAIFKTWIKLNNSPQIVKGVLYEIGDSSIFVSESVSNPTLHEYRFNDIDLMKVRRGNSVKRGVYNGAGIGFVSGIIASFSFVGDASVLTGPLYLMLGMTYGAIGSGVGALAGTIKDRIPIKSSYENFEKYRGNIQDYSYKKEVKDARKRFEHKGYVGFSMGLSVAMDEFKTDVPIDNYRGMKMTGSGATLTAGYRFTDKIGINFMLRTNSYSTHGDNDMPVYWNLDSFTLGPVISFPTDKKYHFDIIPSVGFASAYMYVDNEETYTGEGLAINVTSAFAYNLSKRWVTSFSAGYLSSKQQYKEGGSGLARDIDFKLGLAYKFGKRSL
ncbi:MAG: hypothetical protein A2066_20735 [Bacteroidetes bacterium GWB2_41_8]|nr:MAG: hypothetical protein A2066_20735 [Bacteroidetes bacterium GWB2_41_8]